MNLKVKRVFKILFAVAIASAFIVGCKKDKDTESIPYLHGSVRFKCPTHVRPGYTGTATASGAIAPDGSTVNYYWVATWRKYIYDTTAVYDIIMPKDTVGTFSLSCYAYAKGYNNISSTQYIVIVDDNLGKTITKSDISETDDHFTDSRDGTVYYTTEANGLTWMRNNLAYKDSGVPFKDAEAMRKIYGHYYNWTEASSACPEGWRLPTAAEWEGLSEDAGAMMVDAYFNGERMWEYWPAVKITNSTKMSVLPCGYAIAASYNAFKGEFDYATFWTSDSVDEDYATYKYIHVKQPKVYSAKGDKNSFLASVRCVK